MFSGGVVVGLVVFFQKVVVRFVVISVRVMLRKHMVLVRSWYVVRKMSYFEGNFGPGLKKLAMIGLCVAAWW